MVICISTSQDIPRTGSYDFPSAETMQPLGNKSTPVDGW